MIKERYVSLEVAKLLAEKGFDEPCYSYFWEDEGYSIGAEYSNKPITAKQLLGGQFLRPTQTMACDWLQTKGVLITYDLLSSFDNKFRIKVYRKDYDLDWVEATNTICFNLEDCINDVLEYSLRKLI